MELHVPSDEGAVSEVLTDQERDDIIRDLTDVDTGDLPDRLDATADRLADFLSLWDVTPPDSTDDVVTDLRAAAAELRRLRHRDAALTTLLDAVGDVDYLQQLASRCLDEAQYFQRQGGMGESVGVLSEAAVVQCRIAAAVEGIDQEHER